MEECNSHIFEMHMNLSLVIQYYTLVKEPTYRFETKMLLW
jgi:hypothetical protein